MANEVQVPSDSIERELKGPERHFFVIDSHSLASVESSLYGYIIDRRGVFTDYLSGELNGDGCYVRITADLQQIKIEQDSNGSFGLYLYQSDNYFAISNSFFRLQDFLKTRVSLSVNYDYIYQFLALDLCSLAYEETAINEIKLLDRNVEVIVDKSSGNVRIIQNKETRSEDVPLELGLEILDGWFEKWTDILRGIAAQTNRLTINLSGGFDSRLTFSLALASGCDLSAVRVFSMIDDDNPVIKEDYQIACKIADEYGFCLNNKDFQLGRKSFFTFNQSVDLAFDTKMSFHKKVHLRTGQLEEPLYQLPGVAGELLRKYWNMNARELIEAKGRYADLFGNSIAKMMRASIENVLTRSIRRVCEKYGLSEESPKVGHCLYRETRCRYHFGKGMVEDMAQGIYWLTPLLDKEIHRLKTNFADSEDDNGLVTLIYERFCPKLLGFPFQGGRCIAANTLERAKALCDRFRYVRREIYSKPENFHLLGKSLTGFNNNNSVIEANDVDDYFKRVILSKATKSFISRNLAKETYDFAIRGIEKTGFVSTKPWHAMVGIIKILDNVETSKRAFASNKTILDDYFCDKDNIVLPSKRMPIVQRFEVPQDSNVVVSGSICGHKLVTPKSNAVVLRINFYNKTGLPLKTGKLDWNTEFGEYMYLGASSEEIGFMHSIAAPDDAFSVEVGVFRYSCPSIVRLIDYSVEIKQKHVAIPAAENRFNWKPVAKNLVAGADYDFTGAEVIVESGETEFVEAILYETRSKRFCLRKKFAIKDLHSEKITWHFSVPSSEGEYWLLVYAGVAGKCDGVGVLWKGIALNRSNASNKGA